MRKVGSTTDTADANGEYTNGNVAQGIPPTIINAEMLNTFQRELIGVVEGAGMTLDPADDNQVAKAINKKVGSGRLLNIKTFTSSGTYTPTSGTRYVVVEAVGGGGGGGGCSDTSADNAAVSGGGGSGSYVRTKIDNATIGDSAEITIGIGGAGGVGGSVGTTGGDTKFGSLVIATGGRGGTTSTSSSSFAFIAVGGASGANPSAGNIISSRGSRGGSGLFFNSSTGAVGGDGAPSQFGGSGIGSGSSGTTGSDGSGFGSGGGGNARQSSSASVNGYAGAPGVIVIYEYS
ncbi:TPA: phage tail protein [Serratia liquefaciens]